MPLNKTACRRSARVATRATSAANGRTKALVSTTPGKMSKTSRMQARKSTKNSNSPKVPRQMPTPQEESDLEVGEEEDVSSDEAVKGNTNSISSAQGRERPRTLYAKDGTRNKEHPRDLYLVQTHSQPPATDGAAMCLEDQTANASVWREPRQTPASNRRDGAAVYMEDQTANASTWREPGQPPASKRRDGAALCLEDQTANASVWREPRQPPASNRRDGAAVYVEDQTANGSTWRKPRQSPASNRRDGAAVYIEDQTANTSTWR